jgi:hypothetical protein
MLISGVLVVACGLAEVRAQPATLSGRVVDVETGDPLAGVNVFLDQTTRGAATNEDGRYTIEAVAPGSYRLVAYFVGYDMESVQVEVVPEMSSYETDIQLTPAILELDGVVVEGERPREWERDLQLFEQAFLGMSDNAEGTVITNPYVLHFESIGGNLVARSAAPLHVENRALGYRLTIYMTYFNAGRWVSMGAAVQFEEMEPAEAGEAQRWRRRRTETYEGSLTHLLRSLVAGTTRQEGFYVAHDVTLNFRMRRRMELGLVPFIEATDRPYLYRISLEHPLYVEFGREISWLIMQADEAIVHRDGYVYASAYEVAPISAHGELGKRRIADLLPRDFGLNGAAQ